MEEITGGVAGFLEEYDRIFGTDINNNSIKNIDIGFGKIKILKNGENELNVDKKTLEKPKLKFEGE
jgi:hypothetical protein